MSLQDHRPAIMAALCERGRQTLQLQDETVTWTAIKEAAESAQQDHKRYIAEAMRDKSGAVRRDRYCDLVKNLEAARKSFQRLRDDPYMREPMEWAVDNHASGIVEWDWAKQHLPEAVEYLGGLESWTKYARDDAKAAVVKSRPVSPVARTLDRLAWSLGLIYAKQTGKLPGSSNGIILSPFEKFLDAVALGINLDIPAGAVNRATKRLDAPKNAEFHESLNEPGQDAASPADVFRGTIGKLGTKAN